MNTQDIEKVKELIAKPDLTDFREFITNMFVETAQGTCKGTSEIVEIMEDWLEVEIDADNDISWETVDNWIFECATCGWWCETGELSLSASNMGESNCQGCEPEDEDWQ